MDEVNLKGFLGHAFGIKSSNFTSTYTLRFHALSRRDVYPPEVVEAIVKDFYVDDLLKSQDGVESARRFRIDITSACKDGGFTLCKWRSTHPEALIDEPEVRPEAGPEMADDEQKPSGAFAAAGTVEKILGMNYRFDEDCFTYVASSEKTAVVVRNKRGLLSAMHALYDPMGFISPFVIRARMIFQRAVRAVSGWDDKDELPDDILREFAAWQEQIPLLEKFRIRRWYSTP